MSLEKDAAAILTKAKELSGATRSRTEFSNAVFDPREGLIAKTFPKESDRQAFYGTDEYNSVRAILLELTRKFGRVDEAAPEKSGKFVVRIPKTLHTLLEIEAKSEGVSLNQLATTKLSMPLEGKQLHKVIIIEAFRQVHDGYSTDRVIVDPDLNAKFLERCRDLGLKEHSDYLLNWSLEDIRKSSKGLFPKTTKPTVFRDYDCFEFASEIAIRALQRSSGLSLDQVLCDPELREKFDAIAQKLSPEQSVLKLRCAALNLRKTHRLTPGDVHSPKYDLITAGLVASLEPSTIPKMPGAYVFYDSTRPMFAGESPNLQNRIRIHLQSSGGRGLPDWLEIARNNGLELKYFADPAAKQQARVSWLNDFINREKPLLNYQRAA